MTYPGFQAQQAAQQAQQAAQQAQQAAQRAAQQAAQQAQQTVQQAQQAAQRAAQQAAQQAQQTVQQASIRASSNTARQAMDYAQRSNRNSYPYRRRGARAVAVCSCPQCAASYPSPAARKSYPRKADGTLWDRFLQFLDDL